MAKSISPDPERIQQLITQLRLLVMQRQDTWLDLDLTMPQLRALFVVRRRQPITVSELAQQLDQRLATASAMVTRLVRAGLLARSADPDDARKTQLTLTDQAERLLTEVDTRSAMRFAAVLDRLSPRGRQALAVALDELVHLLTETSDAAPDTESDTALR